MNSHACGQHVVIWSPRWKSCIAVLRTIPRASSEPYYTTSSNTWNPWHPLHSSAQVDFGSIFSTYPLRFGSVWSELTPVVSLPADACAQLLQGLEHDVNNDAQRRVVYRPRGSVPEATYFTDISCDSLTNWLILFFYVGYVCCLQHFDADNTL